MNKEAAQIVTQKLLHLWGCLIGFQAYGWNIG